MSTENKSRTCYVKTFVYNEKTNDLDYNGEEKAIFHRWVERCNPAVPVPIAETMALIEACDGSLHEVSVEDIRFCPEEMEGWFRPLSNKWVKTHRAYASLTTILECGDRLTKKQIFAAIEEAVGDLGEALE